MLGPAFAALRYRGALVFLTDKESQSFGLSLKAACEQARRYKGSLPYLISARLNFLASDLETGNEMC